MNTQKTTKSESTPGQSPSEGKHHAPASEQSLSFAIARFRTLALRGRKKDLHSSGSIRCIELAEWLWRMAPGFAKTDRPAVEGFCRLIELSASAPLLVREILQEEGIVDEKGKEVAP